MSPYMSFLDMMRRGGGWWMLIYLGVVGISTSVISPLGVIVARLSIQKNHEKKVVSSEKLDKPVRAPEANGLQMAAVGAQSVVVYVLPFYCSCHINS